jgi:hypothetical protein
MQWVTWGPGCSGYTITIRGTATAAIQLKHSKPLRTQQRSFAMDAVLRSAVLKKTQERLLKVECQFFIPFLTKSLNHI